MMVQESDESPFVPVRISRDLHERMTRVAKRERKTMTSIMGQAAEMFLNENEYSYNDLLEIIQTNPFLQFHQNTIKKEMENCPSLTCKQLIDIIKERNATLFEETFETVAERIDTLNLENIYGIFIHFSIQSGINRVSEIIGVINEKIKDQGILIGADVRTKADQEKILLIISYKKDGDNNDQEK